MNFLGLNKSMIFNKSIYSFLEIITRYLIDLFYKFINNYAFNISRSRYNGIKATGSFSALEFFKDSATLWYVKKKLKQKNLIRIQVNRFHYDKILY